LEDRIAPTTALTAKLSAQEYEEHRHAFQEINFLDQERDPNGKHLTAEKIARFIRILREWDQRLEWSEDEKKFASRVHANYTLEEETDVNGVVVSTKLMRLTKKTNAGYSEWGNFRLH
jgi:hypothetical protein